MLLEKWSHLTVTFSYPNHKCNQTLDETSTSKAACCGCCCCCMHAKRKILKNLEMENLLQLLNQHGLDNRSLKATENRASKLCIVNS